MSWRYYPKPKSEVMVQEMIQFKSPCGIVASGGNLYITDRDNHRIHKRDTSNSLAYVAKFGSSGSGDGEFNDPYGIDVDTDFIYVCDKE